MSRSSPILLVNVSEVFINSNQISNISESSINLLITIHVSFKVSGNTFRMTENIKGDERIYYLFSGTSIEI